MNYLNDYEMYRMGQMFESHPVLSRAVNFLVAFKEQVDSHSDGWAYWRAPVQSANKLMELLQGNERRARAGIALLASQKDYERALTPIKSFYTRKGIKAGLQWPL